MYQNTQTFSDITDIDTRGALRVRVKIKAHGSVKYSVEVNDNKSISAYDTDNTHHFDLLEPITIRVKLLDFAEGTSGAEILTIVVNQLEILPRYRHLANKDTTYIDTYDEYVLQIPTPFYVWYHQISGQGWIA